MAKNVYVGVNADLKLTDMHQYSIDEMISAGYATADSTWVACSGIDDFAVYYAPSGVLCLWAWPMDDGNGELYIYSTDYLRTGIGYYVRADKWAAGSLPPVGGGSAALEAWFVQGGVATRYYPGTEARARKVKKMYVGVECKAPIGREITYDALLSTLSSVSLSGYSTTVAVIDKDKTKWIPEPSNPNLMPVWITETKDISSAEAGTYFTFIPRGGQLLTGEMNYVALAWKCIRRGSNAVYEEYTVGTTQVARRIKKAYIGVGGVARPCFGHDPIEYYGVITPESSAPGGMLAAASVGNYALFAGGTDANSNILNTVNAYSSSLTRSIPTSLAQTCYNATGGSVGNYALIAGGHASTSASRAQVNAYNSSLARTAPTSLSQARGGLASANAGNYLLFAGGHSQSSGQSCAQVDAYSSSLTRSTPSSLAIARSSMGGARVGTYALFAGGGTSTDVVTAYSSSLARSTPTVLSTARDELTGAAVDGYALFAGGGKAATGRTVDAYNSTLVRSTPTSLSSQIALGCGVSTPDYAYAIFGGLCVNAYNKNLLRSVLHSLSIKCESLDGACAGNHIIFAGGLHNFTSQNAVNAYIYYPDA
jgi:hypothetical protein